MSALCQPIHRYPDGSSRNLPRQEDKPFRSRRGEVRRIKRAHWRIVHDAHAKHTSSPSNSTTGFFTWIFFWVAMVRVWTGVRMLVLLRTEDATRDSGVGPEVVVFEGEQKEL